MQRLMVIDDEENILNALQRVFREQQDWEVELYNDPLQALQRARTTSFDLVLSDYRMPQMNGVEFLCEVKELQPDAMRLILSGQTDREGLLGAINDAQIYRFIDKPWQDYDLMVTLQQALSFREMLLENRILANQVREQQQELDQRKRALENYKDSHPDLFKVEWAADGSIVLDEAGSR